MLTCLTKTGPGWERTCGNEAVAAIVLDSHGEATAYPTCPDHAPESAQRVDLSASTPDDFREWCAASGVASAI